MRKQMEDLQAGVTSLRRSLLADAVVPASLADRTRSALALTVILVGLAMIFTSLFVFGVDSTIKFSSVLTGVIGLVLGYYFGKQGLGRAQDSLAWAQRDLEEARVSVSSVNAQRDNLAAENQTLLDYRDLVAGAKTIAEDHKKAMDFIRAQDMEEEFERV